ncbi:MAG: polysaccharide deacetylase family protein [Paludibacter sp.]|nr:polysaccharide deacetylase family protein [Paludibacter sp.]
MNRRFLIISILFLGLALISCNNATKQKSNLETATSTEVTNDSTAIKQTPNTPAQILAKPQVPVLCYHRIEDGKKGDYTVSTATFSAHMKILSDSGYHSILPAQLYDYLVYNADLPEKPVMITFDDSRIEHSKIAAPVMEKYGFRGAFFIMTITYNKKNYMSTEGIAQLAKAGHTVGMHSWDHTMVTKYKEATDWQKQVIDPKKKLETIVGKPVDYWAYPNGVVDHKGAVEMNKYFKISFILTSKRDSIAPLQTVRRMLATETSAQGLLKSMRRSF